MKINSFSVGSAPNHDEDFLKYVKKLSIKEFKFYVDTINYAIVEDKLNDIITLKDKSII